MMAATLGDLNLVSPYFDKIATSFIDSFCNHCLSSCSLKKNICSTHMCSFTFNSALIWVLCLVLILLLQSLLQQPLHSTRKSCIPLQSSLNLTRHQCERKKSGPIFRALNSFSETVLWNTTITVSSIFKNNSQSWFVRPRVLKLV